MIQNMYAILMSVQYISHLHDRTQANDGHNKDQLHGGEMDLQLAWDVGNRFCATEWDVCTPNGWFCVLFGTTAWPYLYTHSARCGREHIRLPENHPQNTTQQDGLTHA